MMKTTTLLRQRGSMLLQVIASVFVLSAGLTGALSLVVGAMQANRVHSERLIATHLAAEGIEAMQNLRDTNLLLYSDKPSACWNFWLDYDESGVIEEGETGCSEVSGQNDHPWKPATGDPDTEIPQRFIIDLDPSTMTWNLISEASFPLYVGSPNPDYIDGFKLFKKTIATDTDFPVSFYTHDQDVGSNESVEDTFFSRSIALHYIGAEGFIDEDGVLKNGYFPSFVPGDPDETKQDDLILVISEVTWSSGGHDHKVTLSKLLSDYTQTTE